MRSIILTIPLLALSACGYSVFDAAEDISEATNGGMKDGKAIKSSASTLDTFSKLAVTGPDNVIFTKGDGFSIRAEGDADVIEKLRYKIEGESLRIGRSKESWTDSIDNVATIYVTAPTLSTVAIAGSGNVTADAIETEQMKVSIAGSGDATLKALKADKVQASIAGSGDVNMGGEAQSAQYSITGSGDISAKNMKTATAKASIAGSGDIDLFATDSVSASLVGSGDVNVTGGAKCTSKSIGSGDLTCK